MLRFLVVALICIITSSPLQAASEYLLLESGELSLSAQTTPPGSNVTWQAINLPDEWATERYADSDSGWYRFPINIPPPDTLWAVYLPRLNMNAAVYLNGQLLGDGGSFDEPLGRNWSRPLYFTIPAGAWQAEDNRLMVRLKSYYGYGLLNRVMLGPDALLKKEFQRQRFWQIELANALFLVLLAIAAFMLSIWYRRRQDVMYLWFALTTFSWSFLALNMSINEIPVSAKLWDSFMYSNVAWWTVCLALFCHRYANIRRPRLEALFCLQAVGSTLVYFSIDLQSFPQATLLSQLGSTAIGFTVLVLLILAWRDHHQRAVALLATGVGLIQVAGIYSYLTHSEIIPFRDPLFDHILALLSPIMLVIIALHLTRRFVAALNESEALNIELEARVASKHAELEQSYVKLHELEKQQAVNAERERIHRDLHDDVGAKLLSLTYRSGNEENAEIARSALQDLRDVVSRASKSDLSLTDALADWRAECTERLEGAEINLDWQQQEPLPEQILASQQIMNIGRILREAVSNAIRHSNPKNLFLSVEHDDGKIIVTIENDGQDCEIARLGQGRGTQNMLMRAKQLGGELQWQTRSPQGCLIRWWFPLVLPE